MVICFFTVTVYRLVSLSQEKSSWNGKEASHGEKRCEEETGAGKRHSRLLNVETDKSRRLTGKCDSRDILTLCRWSLFR